MRVLPRWIGLSDHGTRITAQRAARRSRRRGRAFVVEVLERREVLSGLTITIAGQAAGFHLSTFATGFPVVNAVGPLGIVFPASGGVLVSDWSGNVRLFPNDTDGQNAATVSPVSGASYAAGTTAGLARVGANVYLMMRNAPNQIAQINDNGTFSRAFASGTDPLGVVVDPLNGHLFVSSFNSKIYDVNPATGAVSVFLNVAADGLAFDSTNGILYAACNADGDQIEGFNIATKARVFQSGTIATVPDGIALGTGPVAGNLFVNTNGINNTGGTVVEINLATQAETVIASGGSRGDFVAVDPNDGTLLLTQSDRIMRLTPGVFVIPPHLITTNVTLNVTPETSISGQPVTLTAIVGTAATGVPTGTVTFTINGKAQVPVSLTEVGGVDEAVLTTTMLAPGVQSLTAAYNGDTSFASGVSNPVSVTVNPLPTVIGEHVVWTSKLNKKGKPVGKPVLVGFSLEYNTAMNSATAGLLANYQVTVATIQHVNKKRKIVQESVTVQPTYNGSTHVVTMTIVGKAPNFAQGGQILINPNPPTGVSSTAGAFLPADDSDFSILPKATGVWPSGRFRAVQKPAADVRARG